MPDDMTFSATRATAAAALGTMLLLGGAGFADAATISGGTEGFATTRDHLGAGTTTNLLSFQQFDTNLGTLTNVRIAIDYNPSWTVVASIGGGEFGDATDSGIEAPLTLRRGVLGLMSGSITQTAACTVAIGEIACSTVNNSGSIDPGSFSNTPLDLADSASLLAFSGSGLVDLTAEIGNLGFYSNFSPVYASSGIQANSASVAWDGEVTVTYTYDAAPPGNDVPEPASLALFGTALGLAGLARRRRR